LHIAPDDLGRWVPGIGHRAGREVVFTSTSVRGAGWPAQWVASLETDASTYGRP